MKILNIKSNNNLKRSLLSKTSNLKGNDRSYNPNNTEWSNSIYHYNNSLSKFYPLLDNLVLKYIKLYFNMYNKSEKFVKLYNFTKRKRLFSSRKVWLSKIQVKHTNDKVIINTYVYDRVNNMIMRKLDLYIKSNKINIMNLLKEHNFTKILNVLYNIKSKIINLSKNDINTIYTYGAKLENLNNYFNKNSHINIKYISDSMEIISNFKNKVKIYTNVLLKDFFSGKKVLLTDTILKNIKVILYCYKYISINTLKYKKIFVINLLKVLSRIYSNKQVVLNIIYLKNYYFNSTILSEIIAHKSRDRKNSTYGIFRKALVNIDLPSFRRSLIDKVAKRRIEQYISINNLNRKYNYNTDNIIRNYYSTQFTSMEHIVLDKIENKVITGIRLEAAGRLTKRFTAEKAVKKIKYVGTLKNIDSSYKGLSTQMIRNNISSNTQYSKMKSKNRIGSFGIKGWISSA